MCSVTLLAQLPGASPTCCTYHWSPSVLYAQLLQLLEPPKCHVSLQKQSHPKDTSFNLALFLPLDIRSCVIFPVCFSNPQLDKSALLHTHKAHFPPLPPSVACVIMWSHVYLDSCLLSCKCEMLMRTQLCSSLYSQHPPQYPAHKIHQKHFLTE